MTNITFTSFTEYEGTGTINGKQFFFFYGATGYPNFDRGLNSIEENQVIEAWNSLAIYA